MKIRTTTRQLATRLGVPPEDGREVNRGESPRTARQSDAQELDQNFSESSHAELVGHWSCALQTIVRCP